MNPYDYNRDIEARLYSEDEEYEDYYSRDSRDSHYYRQGDNLQGTLYTFQTSFKYSMGYNVGKLLISLAKIIASSAVLILATPCLDSKSNWIIAMLIHDIIYFSLAVMTIRLVRKVRRVLARNSQLQYGNNIEQNQGQSQYQYQDQGQSEPQPQPQPQPQEAQNYDPSQHNESSHQTLTENQSEYESESETTQFGIVDITRQITRKQQYISQLSSGLKMIYFVLFIYGQLVFFMETQSGCESLQVDYLMMAFIIMGFVWILSPAILLLLVCLCFPVIIIGALFYGPGSRGQRAANRTIIDNLQVKQFSKDLPGSHECSICMEEYHEGDDIVQLKCSPMHHFHEKCIKQWFNVNGQCPTCRTRLEDMEN